VSTAACSDGVPQLGAERISFDACLFTAETVVVAALAVVCLVLTAGRRWGIRDSQWLRSSLLIADVAFLATTVSK